MKSVTTSVLLSLSLLTACTTTSGTGAPPTPQRPRISHNTQTTAQGTLELEAGVEVDPSDFYDTPMLLKYGVTSQTEFVFGGSPIRHVESPDDTGLGDVVFGVRHRLVNETADAPAIAVATQIKLPTADADEGLGSGETDVFFSIAGEKQIEDVRAVAFYRLGLLGSPVADGNDLRHDLAAVGTVALGEGLNAYGELAGIFAPEYDYDALLATFGAAFEIAPATIFDAGFRVGITDDAPDFTLVFGVTHNFGAATFYTPKGN